jgi:hypothetical protein
MNPPGISVLLFVNDFLKDQPAQKFHSFDSATFVYFRFKSLKNCATFRLDPHRIFRIQGELTRKATDPVQRLGSIPSVQQGSDCRYLHDPVKQADWELKETCQNSELRIVLADSPAPCLMILMDVSISHFRP